MTVAGRETDEWSYDGDTRTATIDTGELPHRSRGDHRGPLAAGRVDAPSRGQQHATGRVLAGERPDPVADAGHDDALAPL